MFSNNDRLSHFKLPNTPVERFLLYKNIAPTDKISFRDSEFPRFLHHYMIQSLGPPCPRNGKSLSMPMIVSHFLHLHYRFRVPADGFFAGTDQVDEYSFSWTRDINLLFHSTSLLQRAVSMELDAITFQVPPLVNEHYPWSLPKHGSTPAGRVWISIVDKCWEIE